jgi:hypothetical protein
MAYYNGARTHLSLNTDAPVPRAVPAIGRILPTPILGGFTISMFEFDFQQGQGQFCTPNNILALALMIFAVREPERLGGLRLIR